MLKAGMLVWLLAMAVAPRPWAVWLAERMLFSNLRPAWINRGLSIGHRWRVRAMRAVPRPLLVFLALGAIVAAAATPFQE